ncbi:MAG: hypothetical protein AAF502_10720 [Bacteroidota bacterium]
MHKRQKFRRLILWGEMLLIFGCISIYLVDIIMGDGDGVIDQFHLNPFSIFICLQVLILLLLGMSSKISWLVNSCLTLFSLLVITILVDIGISMIHDKEKPGIKPITGHYPYNWHDPIYFKNYNPECTFKLKLPKKDGGGEIFSNINKQGIRGPEIPIKDSSRNRVLLIGDSFIQALQVPFEASIGNRLNDLLPDSIEVFQHGFASWSPLLELNWLLRKGIAFDPDHVVFFLFANDLYSGDKVGDSGYMPYTKFNDLGLPAGFDFDLVKNETRRDPIHLFTIKMKQRPLPKMLNLKLRKLKYDIMFPSSKVDKLLQLPAEEFEGLYTEADFGNDPMLSVGWDLIASCRDTAIWDKKMRKRAATTENILRRTNEFLKAKNIEFSIVLIASPWMFPDEGVSGRLAYGLKKELPHNTGLPQWISHFCANANTSFLNLYHRFDKYKEDNPGSQLFWDFDGHWTEEGHRVAAEAVGKLIENHLQSDQ